MLNTLSRNKSKSLDQVGCRKGLLVMGPYTIPRKLTLYRIVTIFFFPNLKQDITVFTQQCILFALKFIIFKCKKESVM